MGVAGGLDHGFIARVFGCGSQLSGEPPCNRVKPEDAAIHHGKEVDDRISAPDVCEFVREDDAEFSVRPGGLGGRQNDLW